ncbi:hypothetical protein AAG906_034426 [Vitis piasezkii]
MNIKFEEEVQGLWLLGTLPDSWETFRTSLSNSAPDGIMNMDLVKSCVLNEEMRRKSQWFFFTSSVLVIEKRRGVRVEVQERDRSKSKTNKDMKQGRVKEKKNDNGSEDDQVATTTSDFLIVYDSDVVNFACQETSWVIDSGASIHATPRKDFFTSYTSGDFGSVRMGNDGSAKAIGMGDVRLETSNGTMLTLKNVKHIPDIRMNLISTGKLDDEGFCNTFRDSQWKLTRGSMVIAKGNKSSSLYLMQARVIDSSINAVDDDSTFELWHNRLGHMSEKGLMILAKKNLLSGMKKGSLKRCAHCLAGKQTRVAFKTLRHTRKPDDHSRKIWVYTLKTKDQVLDVFKQFHALVERQSGEKLKCIRTDNGGEYSGPFDEYCRQHGIRHQKTPPKTPQLNGLAERMNRTRLKEIWSNNEISYDHLRVFGCKAFVHIPKDERSKLDAKTRPCVFIGYGRDELGYVFYDPVRKNFPSDKSSYRLKMKHMMTNMTWVMLKHPQVEDEAHDDQHDMGDVETPTQVEVDDDVHERSPAEAPSDIPLRRSTRPTSFHTVFVDDYVLLTMGRTESYVEAMKDENKMKWVDAMRDEMESLHENHSFELVKFRWMLRRYEKLPTIVYLCEILDDDFVILLLYVDDILIVGKNVSRIDNLKKQLSKSFAMKDLGPVKRILGIRIERDRASKKLCMLQEQYIEKVLARFNMSKAKVVSSPLASHFKLSSRHSPSTDKEKEDMRRVPYASAVGSLMYAMVCTRPDIAYAVGVVSRFLSNPGRHHWEAVKWIMRYLRGTSKLKLTFGNGKPILVGYTDSDMAGDVDNRRSTSGYLMTFSGGAVSWQSRLQKCVALSTTEAEYIAAAEACKELLWMNKNSTYHARSKHIDVRYHWMRDALNDNLFEIEKIHTDNNGSDMLTKTLPREKLGVCCSIAGMKNVDFFSSLYCPDFIKRPIRFVCGPIDLKFEGEIFNSLISNLNGGDRIWSSEGCCFSP